MYSPWALLPAASSSCSLLFRHDFTANSYAIQITNLQVVWAESLDRRRIIGRALDENTAIDPSEDSTQLRLLLDHIRGAFSKDNSRLQVQDLSQSELRLHATSPLPSPLKDLKWSFRLSTTAKQSVATELAAPLMSLAYFQTQQLQQLTESLKQKDVAISKILEKIEAAGFELAAIFPTIASNKKGRNLLSRDQVLQQMQGLKPFDAKTSRTSDVETPRQPLRDMLDVALAGTSAANVQALSESLTAHFLTSSRPSKQLEKVTDGDEDVTMDETAQLSLLATTESGRMQQPNPSPAEDDEFQRQPTPPNLTRTHNPEQSPSITPAKRPRSSSSTSPRASPIPYRNKPAPPDPSATLADDETTDEEDLDAPYVSHNPPPPSPPPQTSQPPTPSSPPPRKTKLGGLRSHTTPAPSAPPPPEEDEEAPAPPAAPRPAKTRLGRLGGTRTPATAAAATTTATAEADEHTPDAGEAGEPSSRRKGKTRARQHSAGTSRGASPTGSRAAAACDGQQTQGSRVEAAAAAEVAIKVEQVRETSVERADRKRDELRRELEEQQRRAAAGQARKKRRF